MMGEKLLEKLLDRMIKQAGPLVIEKMESDQEEIPDVEFSREHNRKMEEIFALARKMEYEAKVKRQATKRRKVLTLAVATIGVFAVMLTAVGAKRESELAEYWFDDNKEYSEVKKTEHEGNSLMVGSVYFGYVPNGFKYEVSNDSSTPNVIYFECESDYIVLKLKQEKWNNEVNTESGDAEDLILNNKDMIYWENGNEKFIKWQEKEYELVLATNCDKSLLLNVAKEIKLME